MEEKTRAIEKTEVVREAEEEIAESFEAQKEEPPEELKIKNEYGGVWPEKYYNILIGVIAVTMAIEHMVYSQVVFISNEVYLTLHMMFSFALLFAITAKKSKSKVHNIILMASIAACVIFTVYIGMNLEMLRVRQWSSTPMDLIIGAVMVILALYSSWLGYGAFMPILVMMVVIYPFFGSYLPEPFHTSSYSLSRTLSNLSIGLSTGLYDSTLSISANYTFLFSVFGGLLAATGVQGFFREFGKLVVGRFRSGSAQITVLNSALVGMVTGSAIANVAIVGPYCIPNMERNGYKKLQAAAICGVGSNGGQIMPPVMGIIAFAMAGYSGVSYWTICKMAIIPALLYYGALALYSHLHAVKDPAMRVKVNVKPQVDMDIIKYKAPGFFIPFIVVITLLALNYSVMTCGFWAIISVIVSSYLAPKRHRPKIKDLLKGFIDGSIQGAQMGCICAIIGMLVYTFTASGMGVKLTAGIEGWSNGNLFIALLILYVASIVAGMAGVSVAAYFTAAAFAVPALQKLGVPYELAHFFCVYPASFSTITPPVALTSLMVSKLAGTPYGKTAIECCKVALVGFLTPFLFVYAPSLVLEGNFANPMMWIDILIAITLTFSFQIAWVGYFLTDLKLFERAFFFVGPVLFILYLILRNPLLVFAGLAAFGVGMVIQFMKYRQNRSARALG